MKEIVRQQPRADGVHEHLHAHAAPAAATSAAKPPGPAAVGINIVSNWMDFLRGHRRNKGENFDARASQRWAAGLETDVDIFIIIRNSQHFNCQNARRQGPASFGKRRIRAATFPSPRWKPPM